MDELVEIIERRPELVGIRDIRTRATLAHKAISAGSYECANIVLESEHLDIFAKDVFGRSLLRLSATSEGASDLYKNVRKKLIEAGATPGELAEMAKPASSIGTIQADFEEHIPDFDWLHSRPF